MHNKQNPGELTEARDQMVGAMSPAHKLFLVHDFKNMMADLGEPWEKERTGLKQVADIASRVLATVQQLLEMHQLKCKCAAASAASGNAKKAKKAS